MRGLHPNLVRVLEEAIKHCPIDFTITEGVRTVERQKELYAQGRTKEGSIVTYADGEKRKSNHQPKADGYGYAVDIYPYSNGSVRVTESYVVSFLKEIATHIKKTAKDMNVNLSWGGDWTSLKDYPHFELDE